MDGYDVFDSGQVKGQSMMRKEERGRQDCGGIVGGLWPDGCFVYKCTAEVVVLGQVIVLSTQTALGNRWREGHGRVDVQL